MKASCRRIRVALVALVGGGLPALSAQAAESFQLRYNIAGSLGGEMFGAVDRAGMLGVLTVTDIEIHRVNGPDGHELTVTVPGGTVALPAPAPSTLYPTYRAQTVDARISGASDQLNLMTGCVSEQVYAGGRLVYLINIPYATRSQTIGLGGPTPPLQFEPATPAATQAAVRAAFGSGYQEGLQAQGAGQSGELQALGDIELQFGWAYASERFRMSAGTALALPTGNYRPDLPSIGYGDFYTLRPAVQAVYLPAPDIALAAKLSVGLNTRNRDNQLRSGDWAGLELAAGYRTPLGSLGVHAVHVQQYQDDSHNPLGASRLAMTNVGVFFTTRAPCVPGASVTLQFSETVQARSARVGRFLQARFVRMF